MLTLLAACMLAVTPGPPAQNQSLEIVQLADGVYAAIHSEFRMDPVEGNSVFVVGNAGVTVFDAFRTPHSARGLIAEIRKVTSLPVTTVVNSHWHDDHIFGNQAFRDAFPGVQFVAHAQTRADMIARSIPSLTTSGPAYWTKMAETFEAVLTRGTTSQGAPLTAAQKERLTAQAATVRAFLPRLDGLEVVLPTMTFTESLVLHAGDNPIEVRYLGLGNSQGDAVLYLPTQKILATGDLVVHPVPFAYYSSVIEWVDTLKRLRAIDADIIVPGHGPVMRDKTYLDDVISVLESLVTQVRAAVARGLSLEDTKTAVDLEALIPRFSGGDPFRAAMFRDSILRSALEQVYGALTGAR